jgi:hypothetical protein
MDGPMKNEDILDAARDRLAEAIDADMENRLEALDDMEHLAGEQWPEEVIAEREADHRPIITINRLPQFVRQVTGDIRKLNPAIKVTPSDSEASEEVAEIIEGLTRQIEYSSDASSVYESAAEQAAQCGMGAFRIRNDYADEDSFEQECRIERIHNPFSVYWDCAARMPTREDAKYCLITEQIEAKAFKELYPDASAVSVDHDQQTDALLHWYKGGDVIVAEYFWVERRKVKIARGFDGVVVEDPEDESLFETVRETERVEVMWAKITGTDILEGPQRVPGKHIPVVAVMGEELYSGDRIVRTGVIRHAKDPQRLYNYWTTAHTEQVALQPKAPYMVTTSEIAGLEDIWRTANDKNLPFLPYNPDPKAPGRPQRMPPPQPSSGMMQEAMKAADDMKATTGIYDAGLGAASNEKSGVAIRQRQMEADVSTSIYTDNLAKSIAHCGRILLSMMPEVYDTNRLIQVMTQEGKPQMVEVNGMAMDENFGPLPFNPLTKGKYSVRVSVGPNYSTRRQETAESMMQFVQAFPAAAALAGDLIAKAMDWPDADKLADRLAKALPPGMRDPEDMPPEEMQQMQQMQQQQVQQQQMQEQIGQQSAMLDLQEKQAGVTEAQADAEKARFEAIEQQLQVAAQTGQLDALIQQAVSQALMGAFQQGIRPN